MWRCRFKVRKDKENRSSIEVIFRRSLMINDNKFIIEDRVNGTTFVGLSVKMKRDNVVDCKNQDRKLVHKVSALDVKYMLCETIPENVNEVTKNFKLKIDEDTAIVGIKIG